jgi:hypothetical protein
MTNDQQLTLDVGGEVGAYVVSEFSFSGNIPDFAQMLEREENVILRVIDADGEVILSSEGWVRSVTIQTIPATNSAPRHTRRKHSIKLGEHAPLTAD